MSFFGFDPEELPPWMRPRGERSRPRRIGNGWSRIGRGWRISIAVVVMLLIALVVVLSTLGLRVNYLFLSSMGHSNVFWTPLLAQWVLFGIGFLITGGLVALNLPFWRASARNLDVAGAKIVTWFGAILAVIGGIGGGLYLSSQWQAILLWLHGRNFGQTDPVFHKDWTFFLFTLPVIDMAQALLWTAVILGLLGAIVLAAASLSAEYAPREIPMPLRPAQGKSFAQAFHIAVLHAGVCVVAIFILAALGAHYGVYHLSTNNHDFFVGLDATERAVTKPVLEISQWVALVLAVVAVIILLWRRHKNAVRTAIMISSLLGGWLVVAGISQSVPEALYQSYRVTPNAGAAQAPSISDFLNTSRIAWGLQSGQDVEVRQFGNPTTPTLQDLAADPQTVSNIRVQDYRLLDETFRQIDRSRAYQNYPNVTVDRYKNPDGTETQVMLGPREISEGDIPNSSFVNNSLLYTHGYGITAVSVNQVGNEGKPVILAGGQPLQQETSGAPPDLSFTNSRKVGDPRMYCGASTTQPVVVNTTQKEFDYPAGSGDQTSHAGSDMVGINPGNALDRLAIASSIFGGSDFLFTNALTPQSKVLIHRQITDRVNTLAPFLTVDNDPYIVADPTTGHLMYIADAYVKSDQFPGAFQQSGGTSYMRNAVKAVVDAKTCQTTLYAVDMHEPITAAYNDIFPELLTPLSNMPSSLRQHLRYPEDLMTAQSKAYAVVHITNPSVLYTKSDVWRLADEKVEGQQQAAQPYYVEMTLPGEKNPQFVLEQTFSPAQNGSNSANNMTAWLAAESDYTNTNHPKLVAVPLNNSDNVLGPLQFDFNINTNQSISQDITLLGQSGSKVILGNVIVLPFNNHSFLYVRPLYVLASNSSGAGSFPQLTEVIVGTQNAVAKGGSLQAALQQLFSTTQPIAGLENTQSHTQPLSLPSQSSVLSGSTPSPTSSAPANGSGSNLTTKEQQLVNDFLIHQDAAYKAYKRGDLNTYLNEQAAINSDADQLRALGLGVSTSTNTPSP